MTITIDTTIPQQNHFVFPSTRTTAAAKAAETDQVLVPDAAATGSVQVVAGVERLGPVFIQDTQGSVSVQLN